MERKELIDSEATTAGAIRQSVGAGERCPYYGGLVNGILADAPANPYLAAINALRELVTLHDDVRYRDPADYEQRKPAAWEAAREALANLPGRERGA